LRQAATDPGLEGTKSWRTQQTVYGQERTLVVTYNEHLFTSQQATVQNDLAQALGQLAAVQQNLQNRAAGLIQGGVKPSVQSVKSKCEQILHRQHLRQLVQTTVTQSRGGVPELVYQADPAAQQKLADTYLGKTLLITGHKEWTDAQVIRAYRSKRSYNPLLCLEANSSLLWDTELRPGNAGTWEGSVELLASCLASLPSDTRELRVRADAGFGYNPVLTISEARPAQYAVVARLTSGLKYKLGGLRYEQANSRWQILESGVKKRDLRITSPKVNLRSKSKMWAKCL
jgi:hypothetical protein